MEVQQYINNFNIMKERLISRDLTVQYLANELGITVEALLRILVLKNNDLWDHVINLDYDVENRFVWVVNTHMTDPFIHGYLQNNLNASKWICFMNFLHETVMGAPDLNDYENNLIHYKSCVSRVSEETPIPPKRYAYGPPNNLDNIGLGTQLPTTKSPKDVAITDIKEGILKILNGDRKFLLHTLKTKIIEYLKSKTIDNNDVLDLYNEYNTMFYRTNERREDDETMDQPRSQSKIIRQNSIITALLELSKFMVGGKKSRSKKRGRKSVHRRNKSIHKKRK